MPNLGSSIKKVLTRLVNGFKMNNLKSTAPIKKPMNFITKIIIAFGEKVAAGFTNRIRIDSVNKLLNASIIASPRISIP